MNTCRRVGVSACRRRRSVPLCFWRGVACNAGGPATDYNEVRGSVGPMSPIGLMGALLRRQSQMSKLIIAALLPVLGLIAQAEK